MNSCHNGNNQEMYFIEMRPTKLISIQEFWFRKCINHNNQNTIPWSNLTMNVTGKHNQSFNADLQNCNFDQT